MTTPDISVVVCTRNRAELLRGALASLYDLATEDEFSYEIVVVDNGSTDETPQVIALATQEAKHPLRGVIESEQGIVAARNRGIHEARGRWIAFFDDDQLADWHWLAELHRGAVEKDCRFVGGSVQLALPAGCNRELAPTVLMLLGESMGGDLPQRYAGRLTPGCGNLMVERGVFDQVGRFEMAIDGRGEDTDLYERVQRAKIDAWYIPTAIIHHLTPAERLEREYLLDIAERMGRGIALRQCKSLGIFRFACLWLARLARIVALEYPRLIWAAMGRSNEWRLARRCELTISQGYLTGVCRTLSPAKPASPAASRAAGSNPRQTAPVFILRSGEPTAVMDLQPLVLGRPFPDVGVAPMKIHSLPARRVTDELTRRWHEILLTEPLLAGPFFRPEFTAAVAAQRADVEIALLEEGSQIVGLVPFQRTRWNVAQPVGGRLSDYQAVIAQPDVYWLPAEIMTACRLSAWEFDHQLTWQRQLRPHFAQVAASPVMNLSAGYDAWLEGRKAAGGALKETLRKMRKLERESASVTFEWHTADREVFDQLLAWKSAQYVRTGATRPFQQDWVVALLDRLRTTGEPHFRGVLSVLRASDKVLAIHLGMQSGGTLHSWFPSYDPEQSRCSPGQILLLRLAEHAAGHGVTRIDLGRGTEDYKLALASETVEVAEGCLDRRPLATAIRGGWSATREWVKQSPLREPARQSLRWLERVGHWLGNK